jgi:23S rRNA pseudouridine1911/1915/1917 synthase
MKLHAQPDDRGLRLDVFLSRRLQDVTRSHIQMLNRAGAVRIAGRQEKAGYRIQGDESIEIDLQPLESFPLEPKHIPLQIYYEDEDLAVVEKPAGLVVHPGVGTGPATMAHGLLFHFQNLSQAAGEGRPGIVHRLDKKTSGLLIVAKNDRAHALLSRGFQERRVEKTYLALVHGKLPRPSGEIELNIGRHSTERTRMAVQRSGGRSAHTEFRVVEEIKGFSFLEVKITTGRTHQIRVHVSAIGHPVVGDDVYGERAFKTFIKKFGDPGRYFLHAAELRFTHPVKGTPMHFRSPLPQDLQTLLERIKQ